MHVRTKNILSTADLVTYRAYVNASMHTCLKMDFVFIFLAGNNLSDLKCRWYSDAVIYIIIKEDQLGRRKIGRGFSSQKIDFSICETCRQFNYYAHVSSFLFPLIWSQQYEKKINYAYMLSSWLAQYFLP